MAIGNFMHLPGATSESSQTLRGRPATHNTGRSYKTYNAKFELSKEEENAYNKVREVHDKLGWSKIPLDAYEKK